MVSQAGLPAHALAKFTFRGSGMATNSEYCPSGGALAVLGALAIACDTSLDLRKDQVVCYAVAAPRVGNSAFAAAYEALVPHTWNVINDQVRQYWRRSRSMTAHG
jgi:hypothetical protein